MFNAAFAILEHATAGGVHWDFLIEMGAEQPLAAWRLAASPLSESGDIPAERIADHRRVYLEYEGEIRGGRGVVRRVERGTACVRVLEGPRLSAKLLGRTLRGEARIDLAGERLIFSFQREASK